MLDIREVLSKEEYRYYFKELILNRNKHLIVKVRYEKLYYENDLLHILVQREYIL